MKKYSLATLAILGISAAVFCGCEAKKPAKNQPGTSTTAVESMDPQAQSFYNSLSADAQIKFNQLDTMHKNKAMQNAMNGGMDGNRAVEEQYNDQMRSSKAGQLKSSN